MSRADRLAWACLESSVTGKPVTLPDGSIITLEPAERILTNREHAERVARKHGLPTGALVPVQVLPCGTTRHHWTEMQGTTA